MVLATYAVVSALTFAPLLGAGLDMEESLWIRGEVLGDPLRLTAHVLLNDVLLPLLGPNLSGYRLAPFLVHLVNATLVYALVRTLGARLYTGDDLWGHLRTLCAGAAGLLFLLHANTAVDRVYCMSYLLAVFFSLCALLVAAAYLRRPHPLRWLLVLAAYALSLLSNLQTHGLWLIIAGVELIFRRADSPPLKLRWFFARYAALLAVFVICIAVFWGSVFDHGAKNLAAAAGTGDLFLQLPRFLLAVFVYFSPTPDRVHVALSGPSWEPFGLGLVALLGILGAWQLLRRGKNAGVLGVWAVFVLAWGGSVFPLLATVIWNANPHRYYFAAAGFAVFLGLGALLGLARAPSRVKKVPLRAILAAAVPALCVCAWLENAGHRAKLSATLGGELPRLTLPRTWSRCNHCPSLESRDPAQLVQQVANKQSTRCSDLGKEVLQEVELTGVDLHGSALIGARLLNARLPGADLRHATLLWSVIHGANLEGANMAGADLSGVELFRSSLARADLRGGNLQWLQAHQSNLAGVRLDGARMQMASMRDCDLRGARLDGADLRNSRLHRSDLRGASLEEARLEGALLPHARYDGSTVLPQGFDPERAGMTRAPDSPPPAPGGGAVP